MKPPKIVLLTDFSPLSEVAIRFALHMAAPLNAEFTLLNVVRMKGSARAGLKLKQIEKMMVAAAEEDGARMIKKLRGEIKGGYGLKFKAVQGHTVAQVIEKYTAKHQTNMVVMGSRGASALKKARMGGTAVSVIDDCPVPVLAIPEQAQYKNLQKIVYASDLQDLQKELDILTEFAAIYDSHIHVIHVIPQVDARIETERKLAEALIAKQKYKKLDFRIVVHEHIPTAIDKYIQETKADLLTTFTHHLNLFEKLFALSVTRTLAYQGKVPLLALKRK